MPTALPRPLAAAVLLALAPAAASALEGPAARVVDVLGLSDARYEDDRRNPDLLGALPTGEPVQVEFSRSGAVEEIEAPGRGDFPAEAVAPLLPAAVRNSPDWPAEARLWAVDLEDDGAVEIEGMTPDRRPFEAEFAPDGRLLEMSYDD